jgi:hypothetical protein
MRKLMVAAATAATLSTLGLTATAHVVPFDRKTSDHIPGSEKGVVGGVNLESIFGAKGFDCSSTAKTDIKNYGFVPLSDCGATN